MASAENDILILKNLFAEKIEDCGDMYQSLRSCSYLRLSRDVISGQSTLVYQYFSDHLLNLAQKNLLLALTKRILKDTLRGLAALHEQNIVHTDIKRNNIFVDLKDDSQEIVVEQVQLGDLEDAARVPLGITNHRYTALRYVLFGVVCIYAVTKRVIFDVEEEIEENIEPLSIVIERQISYFAEEDTLAAFLEHIGDSRWRVAFETLRDGFSKENPRKPFSLWKNYVGVDADFKDLISGLTNFDPAKRTTAH